MNWLADDLTGESVYFTAPSWAAAEDICRDNDWTLVGEYIESQPGPLWLTHGETLQ